MSLRTTLIDAPTLHALPPDDVLIIDCRFDLADPAKGLRDYCAGHIPAAVYANLDEDLSDLSRQQDGLGRHPLPLETAFSALLSRWGWWPGLQVVAYDGAAGALAAARLWWLLRLVGVQGAAVLDGGYAAWLEAGLPVTGDAPATRSPSDVQLHYDATQQMDHAALTAALDASTTLLLDARAPPRYRGEVEPLDPVAGHVPGARNRPFSENLDAAGRFKPAATLRAEFLAALRDQGLSDRGPGQVVHMCGSGITACHNLLAMEHAGLHGSRVYAPSWSGWISDPARPVERSA